MTHQVFISYARNDGSQLAARLDHDLQAAGYSTWRDVRSIDPYQDFSGEIEAGIRSAEFVVVCITPSVESNPGSFVRREILYAQQQQKPLIPLVFPNSYLPTLVNHLTWIPFCSGKMPDQTLEFKGGFARLTERLVSNPTFPDTPKSADPFHAYLTDLYEQIVAYLDRTVFSLIPLQVEDVEGAVERSDVSRPQALPMAFWQVLDEEEPETPILSETAYDNFSAAVENAGGRILLLGEPGAGKTTTLMAYAREATTRRLEIPSTPLPIVVPIATWDVKEGLDLKSWLSQQVTALTSDQITRILGDGEAVLLLDGLDELGRQDSGGNDPRVKFLDLLPANNQIVVTCRSAEYSEIGKKLSLESAVSLRPLENEQLREYLHDQTDLWQALTQDEALRDITRTPLLLSLFAFAYAGLGQDAAHLSDLGDSPGALRAAVIRSYVTRRYQHEERRLRIRPAAGLLPFSLDRIYEVLGTVTMVRPRSWSFYKSHLERVAVESGDEQFVDFVIQLNLLLAAGEKTVRFIHPLFLDHFQMEGALSSLNSNNTEVISKAVLSLEYLASEGRADERALEPLYRVFCDGNRKMKRSAALGLGYLGDERVTAFLAALPAHVTRYESNSLVPRALERIGTPEALAGAKRFQQKLDEDDLKKWEEWDKHGRDSGLWD